MEHFLNNIQPWLLTTMVSIIAYFLKSLLKEQKDTRLDVTELLKQQSVDQTKMIAIIEQITELKKSDDRQSLQHSELSKQMVEALGRLVRLEERSNVRQSHPQG
jgi:histidyl-tRNA synthetase